MLLPARPPPPSSSLTYGNAEPSMKKQLPSMFPCRRHLPRNPCCKAVRSAAKHVCMGIYGRVAGSAIAPAHSDHQWETPVEAGAARATRNKDEAAGAEESCCHGAFVRIAVSVQPRRVLRQPQVVSRRQQVTLQTSLARAASCASAAGPPLHETQRTCTQRCSASAAPPGSCPAAPSRRPSAHPHPPARDRVQHERLHSPALCINKQ